jgi:hypothetical protein
MSEPRVIVVIPLEGRPTVHYDASHEKDVLRLQDWVGARPLLQAAIRELEEEGRAV